MRQRSRPAVPHNTAVVENLLKLGGRSVALSGCQVCLCAYIRRIEAGDIVDERNCAELERGGGRLQGSQGSGRILLVQRQLPLNRGQPVRLDLRVQRETFPQV